MCHPATSSAPSSSSAAPPPSDPLQQQIKEVADKIKEVEQELKETKEGIKEYDRRLKDCKDAAEKEELKEERRRLAKDKEQLQEEKNQLQEEKNLLLRKEADLRDQQKQQPAAGPFDLQSLRAALREDVKEEIQPIRQDQQTIQRRMDDIPRIVAEALPASAADSEIVLSPAHLAIKINKQLRAQRDADVKFVEPVDGSGTPVLDAQQQVQVSAVQSEAAMVARLTPYLWRWLCGDGAPAYRCLVNSETKKWLEVEAGEGQLNQKPDLWLGPSYIVEELPAPMATEKNTQEKEAASIRAEVRDAAATKHVPYVFGKPATKRWFDSVFPLAAKLSLTDTALGEEMIYLKHLSGSAHPFSRGMAYDKEKFVLLKCVNKKISWRLEGHWTQRGSGERIRDFFSIESEWETAIRRCCSILAVEPVRYLGCGGTARVIEVRRAGQLLALKTILEPHIEMLASEYCRLRDLLRDQSLPADLRAVLPDTVGSHIELPDKSAGAFLISPVGEPLARENILRSLKAFTPIFTALRALHSNGQRHGDPRLPNLLRRRRMSLRGDLMPGRTQLPSGAASGGFSSSSAVEEVTIHDPITRLLPQSGSDSLSLVSQAASSSSRLMWIDFMVSNVRTTLVSDELHRFDDDLLLFTGYLAQRKYTRLDTPPAFQEAMLEYHRRLTQHNDAEAAEAFFRFLREVTTVSSSRSADCPSQS